MIRLYDGNADCQIMLNLVYWLRDNMRLLHTKEDENAILYTCLLYIGYPMGNCYK